MKSEKTYVFAKSRYFQIASEKKDCSILVSDPKNIRKTLCLNKMHWEIKEKSHVYVKMNDTP